MKPLRVRLGSNLGWMIELSAFEASMTLKVEATAIVVWDDGDIETCSLSKLTAVNQHWEGVLLAQHAPAPVP